MIARATIVLLVCGTLGVLLEREAERGTFDAFNRRAVGWLFPVTNIPAPVVLVALHEGAPDPARIKFDSWPPDPLDFALIFESLARRQPRAVAVEPLLDWAGISALDAATLAERVTLLPRAVLACILQKNPVTNAHAGSDASADAGSAGAGDALIDGFVRLNHIEGNVVAIPAFTDVLVAPAPEVRAGRLLGFTRIDLGENPRLDGWQVRVPLLARRRDKVYPSLALQTLMNWQGATADEVKISLGREIAIGPGRRIPIDDGGALTFDARFSPASRSIDASGLLLDETRDAGLLHDAGGSLEALRSLPGAVAVVGDTGSVADEFKPPRGRQLSHAEIIAQAIGRMQTGNYVREIPRQLQRLMWGLIVIIALAQSSLRPGRGPLVTAVLVPGLVTAVLVTFRLTQVWLPPIELLALAVTGGLVAALVRRSPKLAVNREKPGKGELREPATNLSHEESSPE